MCLVVVHFFWFRFAKVGCKKDAGTTRRKTDRVDVSVHKLFYKVLLRSEVLRGFYRAL